VYHANPANPRRRRRRRHTFARHSRRRRHNPRFPGLGGQVGTALTQGIGIGIGAIGTNFVAAWVNKRLPANLQNPLVGVGIKAGIGLVGLPLVLRMTPLKGFVRPIMLGTGVAIAIDLWQQYAVPALHLSGLGEYAPEGGMGTYAPIQPDMVGLGWGQDSMYSDSMYT
jgi:hypothetical protein